MHFFFVFILSTDIPFPNENFQRQTKLMDRFFQDVNINRLTGVSPFLSWKGGNYCHLKGISCAERNKIVTIRYEGVDCGQFDITSLPPNVKACMITKSLQRSELCTRTLPRDLERLNLRQNRYYGRLDLGNLPQKIVKVELRENSLTGPISLIALPRSLRVLNLHSNKIRQHVVWYDTLPENIECIRLINKGEKRGIGQVHATHPGVRANPKVFLMMSPEMVE